MPNPSLLFCDSDALIQLFIASELRPFRELKRAYSIQPVIVAEVELELSWTKKFGSRFDPILRKAISSDLIRIFDLTELQTFLSSSPVHVTTAAATWGAIQALGAHYRRRVQTGEAYTYATAAMLQQPALSNDFSAIQALERAGLVLPSPVLRTFDVLVFAYQAGILSDKDCGRVRDVLLKECEWIPRAFARASFLDGLDGFVPRLLDGAVTPDGGKAAAAPTFSKQLYIFRISVP